MKPKIIVEEVEEVFWWDLDKDVECGAPTGTPWQPYPNAQQRTRLLKVRKHVRCGGEVHTRHVSKWKGHISFQRQWDECNLCHKKFNLTEWE